MITIVMGKPGVGKSSYLAWASQRALRKGREVYSNVHIKGTTKFNIRDLGNYQIDNALVIIDEAGHEFNARDFKKFTNELYRFFTIHRHYGLDIILAVQFWDRLDIVIRELTQKIIVVKPTLFKPIAIKTKEIAVKIDVSEEKQIVEQYQWIPFSFRYYLKRPLWKYFDSFYLDTLPTKRFEKWTKEEIDVTPTLAEKIKYRYIKCKEKLTYKLKYEKIDIENKVNEMFEGE